MSDVIKRCDCPNPNKCACTWTMKKFIWEGKAFKDNVTRWALVTLGEVVTTRTRADEVVAIMRTQIRAGTFVSSKTARRAKPKAAPDATLVQLVAMFRRDVLDAPQINDDDATSEAELAQHRMRLQRLVDYNGYGALAARSIDGALLVVFRTSPGIADLGRSSWAKYRGIYRRLFAYAKTRGIVSAHPYDDVDEEQHKALKRRQFVARDRRLKIGEEGRLLGAARVGRFPFDAQRLHDLIVTALECAGRFGELLALRWSDVTLATYPAVGVLTFTAIEHGAKKSGKGSARTVPISDRLHALLVRRQLNALTGRPFPASAYVFGDEVGGRLRQIKSWAVCVVRAEGHEPKPNSGNLDKASRAVYKAAGLHFHDLRRECASRWLETGLYTLREIQDLLGHDNIATTSIYLGVHATSTIDAMRRFNERQRQLNRADVAVGENSPSDPNADPNPKPGAPTPTGPTLVKGRNSQRER